MSTLFTIALLAPLAHADEVLVIGEWCTAAGQIDTAPFTSHPSAPAGTEADPYRICTATQLQAVADDSSLWSAHFALEADLDLWGHAIRIGDRSTPFNGGFDGQDHILYNLRLNLPDTDYVGLFGYSNATYIRNITLWGADITGRDYVGVFGGNLRGSEVSGLMAGGTVVGRTRVGGLAGEVSADFSNSYAYVDVSGETWVGGAAGMIYARTTRDVAAFGAVAGTRLGIGGLAGHLGSSSFLSDGWGKGDVTAPTAERVGGLIGDASGTIEWSMGLGNVVGDSRVGGLVGTTQGSAIGFSGAEGAVSGTREVGGLIGSLAAGAVDDCWATGDTDATTWGAGGLVGGLNHAAVRRSWASGDAATGESAAGGLVGNSYGGELSDVFALGDASGMYYIGGLAGLIMAPAEAGSLTRGWSGGDVHGAADGHCHGGLVGVATGSITQAYSLGAVHDGGYEAGGFAGCNDGLLLTSVLFNSDANPGMSGVHSGDEGTDVHPCTEAELNTPATFEGLGWDLEGETGNGYDDYWRQSEGEPVQLNDMYIPTP